MSELLPPHGDGPRVAMLSVHTSPLEQPGIGDAGGMNVYIMELSKALAEQGAEVDIFTRRTSSLQKDVVEAADGVFVRHITAGPFEGLDKNDLPSQLCYFTQGVLRTEAGRQPNWYQAVHSHYWLSGQAGWLAADRWNVPLVHSMHTMARVKNAQLAPGDHPEPVQREIGEEQVVAESAALIANTKHEAHELVDYYHADPRLIHVIPPGVDLDTFSDVAPDSRSREQERADHGIYANQRVIVFAGRIQPLKGPDVLVEMLGILKARCTNSPQDVPTLVVLGGASGKKTALKELKALVHNLGIADHVRFEPPAKRLDLAQWFRIADLVAMPSRNESFGLVAVEAQACGTPVIAAAVGGLRLAVSDGVSGILMNNHDPRAWANAVSDYFIDLTRQSALKANARSAAACFTWQHTAKATLEVYDAVGKNFQKVT